MDKTTRMLILYQRLLRGDFISKPLYTMEFEITERSFDRDIQAMRLFLSDSFSNLEVIYDESCNSYRLKNPPQKHEIAIGECYILSKLLLDSRLLRSDDQSEILRILRAQLTPDVREHLQSVMCRTLEPPICLEKISVKLITDLLFSIARKDRITLKFRKEDAEISCAPYSLEFCGRKSFLVGWEIERRVPVLYALDEILSYDPANQPFTLGHSMETALQALIAMISCAEDDRYKTFLHQKESE